MRGRAYISKLVIVGAGLMFSIAAFAGDTIDIQTTHPAGRELQEKLELQQLLTKYDVSKYTFTRTVVIDERAMNHAFPVLTLNVHYVGSDDELLSSFLHRSEERRVAKE